jgi:hypothetical protein
MSLRLPSQLLSRQAAEYGRVLASAPDQAARIKREMSAVLLDHYRRLGQEVMAPVHLNSLLRPYEKQD